MSVKTCCPTEVPPSSIASTMNYSFKGEFTEHQGYKFYVVGNKFKSTVLLTYDIFGFHPCTLEFCDRLSENSMTCIIMPDFFAGKPWPLEPWPPEDFKPLLDWIDECGSYTTLEPIYASASRFARSQNKQIIAGVGLCWGAKPMISAHKDKYFGACATVHPSFLETSDAEILEGPICVITSKDDPELKDFRNIVESKSFGKKCLWDRYEDMHHGFCGARRDPSVHEQEKRMNDAVMFISRFLDIVRQ